MPPAKTWTLGIPPIEICGIKMGHRRQGKTDTNDWWPVNRCAVEYLYDFDSRYENNNATFLSDSGGAAMT
jgi:hypothetical protein